VGALKDEVFADSAVEILQSVRRKGVRVWLKEGQLHIKAPRNVLTQEDSDKLRASGRQIAVFLAKERNLETPARDLETPVQLCAPLTFSQLAHWNLYRLGERRGTRSLATALRLRGKLDFRSFEKSLEALFPRHDALRTRIAVHDGVPEQQVGATGNCRVAIEDLSDLRSDMRDAEAKRRIRQLLLEPVDVTRDPLLAIQLLKLNDTEHVLIAAVEHIIADGVSIRILMRDLLTAYAQIARKQPVSLPVIETQFSDHAVWQRNAHAAWLNRHGAYWRDHLQGCQRLKWPTDVEMFGQHQSGWDAVPIRIDRALRMRLHERCRLQGVTPAIAVFTAFVAVVLRWCSAQEGVFQFQMDGRVDARIENTIGYFAAPLLLRLGLDEGDRPQDLMKRIVSEYIEAQQHADSSYIESQTPRPPFACNSIFNWIAHEQRFDRADVTADSGITSEPFSFENPMLSHFERDNEPSMLLVDHGHEIAGYLQFQRDRHSPWSMATLGRLFLTCIEQFGSQG
jgi:Condensation domain/TubC N-terminal docking domain